MSSLIATPLVETYEICCSSLAEVQVACSNGADRIELCSGMEFDGLTPSDELIKDTIKICSEYNVEVVVMLRCRGGDFIYSSAEIDSMLNTLRSWKKHLSLDGVVFGALSKDNTSPDVNAVSKVVECAAPWPVTFHKAIDCITAADADTTSSTATEAAMRVIDQLHHCGVRRVLTSGLHSTAEEGRDVLSDTG
ncbi:hypothetical protein FOZ60_017175 [Perkinsus olseni]|uniref:Copper homeostasis protein cutC homolog n=1 Tax=Perkinsus olseni TaxID=32597 RepID=A0A7J6P480_PEROL|nr:hypothetical protein FOZ60_017175 [Perkinsus olseni]